MSRPVRIFLAACASLLFGCASVEPAHAPERVLAPNPHLHAEGIPPLPMPLVEDLRRYIGIAGHSLVDWHPLRPELLVAHRPPDANTTQLYRLRQPMGSLEPLTAGPERVTQAEWEPRAGRYLVFARSRGGDEADQLYRLDPDTGQETLLTEPGRRHTLLNWLHAGSGILVASVPLDRTAPGGQRGQIGTTLTWIDPLAPASARVVARLPGIGWSAGALAPDDRHLAMTRSRSSTDTELWLVPIDRDAAPQRLLPRHDGDVPAVYLADAFSADGRQLFLRSDAQAEFRELVRLDLSSRRVERLSAHIPWDVTAVELSPDGRRLALQVNAGGREALHIFDAHSGAEVVEPNAPKVASVLATGLIERFRWHRASGALALQISSAQGPGQIHALDAAGTALVAWTTPVLPPGIDPSRFVLSTPVHWRGADGLALSGWLTRPDPTRFPGPRPVFMLMHGGPAAQADAGWLGRYHYLVEQLGVAVLQPNVRGSMGFGKTFLALDDGLRREDAVQDMGALLDWIATQPDLDARRVVVMGGSYGGYMSLAASVHFADRISGAVSTVGISNFVTFLRNTESYRRDRRRTEYGDERDPAMRDFLERISPLNHVDRITKPLLVVHGRNDPRVPWTEAEQIVRRLQQRGGIVWYLLADNEGHGFARRENAEAYFATVVRFLDHVWKR